MILSIALVPVFRRQQIENLQLPLRIFNLAVSIIHHTSFIYIASFYHLSLHLLLRLNMLKYLLLLLVLPMCSSFVVVPMATTAVAAVPSMLAPAFLTVAVGTVDPTMFLSDVLGGFINSPAILAVPIGAALSVAFLFAWLVQAYATPQVEDDEQ